MKRKMKVLIALKFVEDPENLLKKSSFITGNIDASIYLVHVLQDMPRLSFYSDAYKLWEEFRTTAVKETLKQLNKFIKKFGTRFPDIEPLVDVGDPAEVILQIADKLKVDLIVVGNEPRSRLQQMVHQNVGEKVVRLSKRPVLSIFLS